MQASGKPSSNKAIPFETMYQGITQAISLSSSSTQLSNPFQKKTTIIQVCTTVACSIQIGSTASSGPTAVVATSMYIPANQVVRIGVPQTGQNIEEDENETAVQYTLAAIGTSGTLYVTEGA